MSLMALTILAIGFASGVPGAGADSLPAPPEIAGMFDPDDAVYAAGHAAALTEQERQNERFTQNADERHESRTEFSGVSDAIAVSVAREEFPEALTGGADLGALDLPNGLEVDRFTDENHALIKTATGQPYGLLESLIPLTTDSSLRNTIDLDLQEDASGDLSPADPRADVTIPERANEPTTLNETGIGFAPTGADSVAGVERSDRVLYPSINTDTESIVQPTELGAEAYWQLRSPRSPSELRLSYNLPAGAHLENRGHFGGAASVTIVKNDHVVGVVKPVTAVDASGRAVEVTTTVDGSDLVLDVEHDTSATQYPVLVDPVTESWAGAQWNSCGVGSPSQGWVRNSYGTNGTDMVVNCGNLAVSGFGYGMWLATNWGGYYNTGSTVQMTYRPPPNTYISDLWWNNYRHQNVANTAAYVGIWCDSCGAWRDFFETRVQQVARPVQQTNSLLVENRAVLGMGFISSATTQGAITGIDGVSMIIRDGQDPSSPTIASDTPTSSMVGDTKTYALSNAPSLQVSARDIGLGTAGVAVQRPNGNYMWGPFVRKTAITSGTAWSGNASDGCKGTVASRCPTDLVTSGSLATPRYGYSGLVEGDNAGTVMTWDAGGRVTYGPKVNVRYDGTAPPAPTNITAADANPSDTGDLDVFWSNPADPSLTDGSPGSGVVSWNFRWRKAGGSWSAYSSVDEPAATAAGADLSSPYEIQIQAVDAAGNVSSTASATVKYVDPDVWSAGLGVHTATYFDDSDEDGYGEHSVPDGGGGTLSGCNVEASSRFQKFSYSTSPSKGIRWGYKYNAFHADSLLARYPNLRVNWSMQITINNRYDRTAQPKPQYSPLYHYHGSFNTYKVNGVKRRLAVGDLVSFRGNITGSSNNGRTSIFITDAAVSDCVVD